jgi:hypothetical protein
MKQLNDIGLSVPGANNMRTSVIPSSNPIDPAGIAKIEIINEYFLYGIFMYLN